MYNAGADLFAIQDLLGHASPETTRMYVRVGTEHTKRAIDLLPDFGAPDTSAPALDQLRAHYAAAPEKAAKPARPEHVACAFCGEVFTPNRYKPGQRFCKTPCRVADMQAQRAAAREKRTKAE